MYKHLLDSSAISFVLLTRKALGIVEKDAQDYGTARSFAVRSLWLWKAMAFLNHSYTCVLQSAATDEAAMFWGAFRLVWSAVRFVCFVLFLASSSDSASPYVCWGGFQLR